MEVRELMNIDKETLFYLLYHNNDKVVEFTSNALKLLEAHKALENTLLSLNRTISQRDGEIIILKERLLELEKVEEEVIMNEDNKRIN